MKKINVSSLINVILLIVLVIVVGFGWFYLQKVNPLTSLTSQMGTSDAPLEPKYLYTIQGIGKEKLETPNQVLVNNNKIYVADSGNDQVVIYDYTGTRLKQFSNLEKGKKLGYPYGMAVLNSQLLVADVNLNKIAIFDLDGNFQGYFAKETNMRPSNIEVSNQNVYVTDVGKQRILKFDLNGKLLIQVGKEGEKPDELYYPQGLKVVNGKLYVADSNNYRLKVYNADTLKMLEVWDRAKFNNEFTFAVPRGIAYDGNRLWISSMLASSVTRFDLQGKRDVVVSSGATPDDKLTVVNGIFIDNYKRLYIADRALNNIVVYQIQ
ncbi:MAG: 6-bladed beta-propeller [Carboxydocellales bacterium]